MNEDPFQSDAGREPGPEDSLRAAREHARQAFEDLIAAAKGAWATGSKQAQKAAEDKVPKARDTLQKAAYELTYDFAYGATFAAALVRSLIPDTVGEATKKGAEAGEKAAEDYLQKRRTPEASGPEEQPGH